ncbi:MAG: cytochrome C oxidase subunit IV family protein [Bdellovibrionales bacterium]|nr:cytochrome C oxidase subunit IV family protein [Bdellovibrionales bacterium]
MSGHHETEIDPHDLGHIVPFKIYVRVLSLLIILTAITVGAAYFDFGNWNLVVAMIIASVKATLVAMFFMHLKFESPITWVYALIPIFLLAVLLAGLFIDNPFRY